MCNGTASDTLHPFEEEIKRKAFSLGFDACGIATAKKLDAHEERLKQWLGKGFHATMAYMERNIEKRLDPRLLFPGAHSVVVMAHNYFPDMEATNNRQAQHWQQGYAIGDSGKNRLKIAKYAWGQDYHTVIKKKLFQLIVLLEKLAPGTQSRAFVDSAPVLERAWAVEAGIGWIGKNGCLIIPRHGSFFFLATIITSLALRSDQPQTTEHCGKCTRCIDHCPTAAIVTPYTIDAGRCLSYQTIENKDPIPHSLKEKSQGWIFGCDICQDVCPHNRFATPHSERAYDPLNPIRSLDDAQWRALTESTFKNELMGAGSPMARITHQKLLGNM